MVRWLWFSQSGGEATVVGTGGKSGQRKREATDKRGGTAAMVMAMVVAWWFDELKGKGCDSRRQRGSRVEREDMACRVTPFGSVDR